MSPSTVTTSPPTKFDERIEGRIVVAACDETGGIGYDGQMPWPRLQQDMRHFRRVTASDPVLMGRKTYQSLPSNVRPLPGRLNVVLSQNQSRQDLELPDDVLLANSLEAAEELLINNGHKVVYVIGGEDIFSECMKHKNWSKRIYLTSIHSQFKCDRFFPIKEVTENNEYQNVCVSNGFEDNNVKYSIREYIRRDGNNINNIPSTKTNGYTNGSNTGPTNNAHNAHFESHEEYQYINLVKRI